MAVPLCFGASSIGFYLPHYETVASALIARALDANLQNTNHTVGVCQPPVTQQRIKSRTRANISPSLFLPHNMSA